MTNFKYYFQKSLRMPPHILIKKMMGKFVSKWSDKVQKARDLNGTYVEFYVPLIKTNYIELERLNTSNISQKEANYLSSMYLKHRFDLLGSGWVKNSYESDALGVEGYQYKMNRPAPSSSQAYSPIDWQKDFKSGFRWDEKSWYKDQRYGIKSGADIKVPWELARMQHLPQLALFALVDENLKEENIKEFKCQIFDFIANNPPRMGVNWTCTMDVGIRVANMLVAYDLFSQLDNKNILDQNFKQRFANSIYEHGIHIVNNLEYSEELTSNHYLSNIAGLLFVAAYLENSEEINQWLAFSVQELIREMEKQFYEDGGNFESSTNYHRLSGELMVYSTALILALKGNKLDALNSYDPKGWRVTPKLLPRAKQQFSVHPATFDLILPQWYIDRLYKIGRFTVDLTKPNGEVPQIGDNDSGRFFRFSPSGKFITNREAVATYLNLKGYAENDDLFWDENSLDHRTFISAMGGLFDDDIFKTDIVVEASIVRSMAKKKLTAVDTAYKTIKVRGSAEVIKADSLIYKNQTQYRSRKKFHNLKFISYPDSGIYIYTADNLHLTICGTPLGQNGSGGHTHNDKLSYELWMDGEDVVRDPGTYLYTPLPEMRNKFRSVKAHNVPVIDDLEPNDWRNGAAGLFSMFSDATCSVYNYGDDFIELFLAYKDVMILRRFEVQENGIIVKDSSNKKFNYSRFDKYSNGYGKVMSKQ